MCGRYTLTSHEQIAEDLQASLDPEIAADPWWKPRFNVAPTQPCPVVTRHRGDRATGRAIDHSGESSGQSSGDRSGERIGARTVDRSPGATPERALRTIELMRWGLVPHWAEPGGKKPPLLINARVESLTAKQMFRDALAGKRCLVPMDGFFEWARAAGGSKQTGTPFYFHPRRGALCAFAGLWARSRDARGDELHSFTIITTRASELVRPIHDRMPIVLAPEDWAAWLDPEVDADAARARLAHPAGEDWLRESVSSWVNKADHDDARCIEPMPAQPAAQTRLFE